MLCGFKSKATCDLILRGPWGDRLLRVIGKQPAEDGIIGTREFPEAMQAIALAISLDEARPLRLDSRSEARVPADRVDGVTLRQLAWPFVEMMKLAYDEGEAIVWHRPGRAHSDRVVLDSPSFNAMWSANACAGRMTT